MKLDIDLGVSNIRYSKCDSSGSRTYLIAIWVTSAGFDTSAMAFCLTPVDLKTSSMALVIPARSETSPMIFGAPVEMSEISS